MRKTVWIIPFLCAFWLLHTHTHKHKHTRILSFQDLSHLCKEDEEDCFHGPLIILSFLNLDRHLVLSKYCNLVRPRTQTHVPTPMFFIYFFNGKEAQEQRTNTNLQSGSMTHEWLTMACICPSACEQATCAAWTVLYSMEHFIWKACLQHTLTKVRASFIFLFFVMRDLKSLSKTERSVEKSFL